MAEYPEHVKLKNLDGANETIGDFLEWLDENGMVVCQRTDNNVHNLYWPVAKSVEQLIAEFFGLDRKKLEDEKRAMLDEIRRANGLVG